jgi:hypothetical protein
MFSRFVGGAFGFCAFVFVGYFLCGFFRFGDFFWVGGGDMMVYSEADRFYGDSEGFTSLLGCSPKFLALFEGKYEIVRWV